MGGSDSVRGGPGADALTGGTGQDELRGESGADILNSADGGADEVGCGADIDTVNGEAPDSVEGDCEVLHGGATIGGPPGPRGAQGPAGTATCVVGKPKKKGKKVKVKVKCTVAPAAKRAHAKLTRHGRTVARGSGDGSRVTLGGHKRLKRGRYVLTVGSGDDRSRTEVRIG
jgi:hypothetical protein